MRVISGSSRGRKLIEPVGIDIRPTTDRVKESIFNIIQFGVEGRSVLDLFAGTGQLGIECLSRGARGAVFVDSSPQAIKIVRANLDKSGFTGRARVVQGDYSSFISGANEKFDLIFLDPPYGGSLLENALSKIASFDILSENGIIICESGNEKQLPEHIDSCYKYRDYLYGKVKITLYKGSKEVGPL